MSLIDRSNERILYDSKQRHNIYLKMLQKHEKLGYYGQFGMCEYLMGLIPVKIKKKHGITTSNVLKHFPEILKQKPILWWFRSHYYRNFYYWWERYGEKSYELRKNVIINAINQTK